MGGWVLWNYASFLPSLFADVFHSAFTPRAAEGGFIGCTLLMTITQGIRRGCYSADIGVGYASIIHSETTNPSPIKQARLLIVEVFVDTFFICTMSAILVLITGVWKQDLLPSQMVQQALATRFPYMHFFMPVLLTLLGYSTVLTYLSAGMKSATYLSSTKGKVIFSCYALFALSFFSFVETSQALSIMSFINLFLLILNSVGIWRLRREIVFDERQKFSELVIDQT